MEDRNGAEVEGWETLSSDEYVLLFEAGACV